MTKITLNKCLSKLDSIIFGDIDDYKEEIVIRDILNSVRKYLIDSIQYKKYDKEAFMLIIEFINYLIQESYESITNLYIIRLKQLRFLILKFIDNRLHVSDRKWDFDIDCYTILKGIVDDSSDSSDIEEQNGEDDHIQ